jgi:hypothetical protein
MAPVSAPPPTHAADEGKRRQQQRIDGLWRAWSRNRGDVDALRELHEAIGECLTAHGAAAHSE